MKWPGHALRTPQHGSSKIGLRGTPPGTRTPGRARNACRRWQSWRWVSHEAQHNMQLKTERKLSSLMSPCRKIWRKITVKMAMSRASRNINSYTYFKKEHQKSYVIITIDFLLVQFWLKMNVIQLFILCLTHTAWPFKVFQFLRPRSLSSITVSWAAGGWNPFSDVMFNETHFYCSFIVEQWESGELWKTLSLRMDNRHTSHASENVG